MSASTKQASATESFKPTDHLDEQSPVLVCSQQTIEKRGYLDNADLIIVDEAHVMRRKTTEMLLYMDKFVIGLTATPMTDGLGEFYESVCKRSKHQTIGRCSMACPSPNLQRH